MDFFIGYNSKSTLSKGKYITYNDPNEFIREQKAALFIYFRELKNINLIIIRN